MKITDNNETGFIKKVYTENIVMEDSFYKEMFDVMIQNAPVSMYVMESESFSYINDHFCHLVGYSKEELLSGKMLISNLFHLDDLPMVQESIKRKMKDQEQSSRYRARVYKKDGELIHVEIHSTKTERFGKTVLFGTLIDVTGEVAATLRLKENEERFKSLFYNNPDAIFTIDLQGNFIDANPGCLELTGYSAGELLGTSFAPLIAEEDLEAAFAYFAKAAQGEINNHTITLIQKDFTRKNLEITKFPMKLAGEIVGVYGIAKDITEKVEHQKLMEELIFFDSLTKLPNRKLFEDRLMQVFKLREANDNPPAVLFLDLDRFKFINDSLGHHLGDEFLKIVAKRLIENVNQTDTVSRFAGDEFAILLPNPAQQEAIELAKLLNKAMAEPFDIMGHSFSVSASIGIAFSTGTDETVDSLIKKADTAMYYTKKYGKNNYTIYSEELDQKTAYKLILERDLKLAITNQELTLHYQPIIDLKTEEVRAMEALIRWNHPELGLVPPDSFIPISEESGQIVAIGKWVLYEACAQNKAWQNSGFPSIKICVNISTIQLQHPNFIQTVQQVLEDTGLEARWLELEVTESILMEETKTLKDSLIKLKALGISLSIDDFGTGYTSLSYLRQFSFDRVKIDRSFVSDIAGDLSGKAITSTIISLAHKLDMQVIAEGIEDEVQLSFLKDENCDEGQGYYFSRPLPAELHNWFKVPGDNKTVK
ncbi:PAS domain S-box-containing protein/diguanylate cyclase (GGDEF)-like protein [Planomicrobium soli]|uniref:PAS domain S-box-containing protein/diguanylate cyclase (GGDEF)-like protein n=1 Tax=Planomicrobium soli TaxID=1176648 RepID=A0A2P8H1J4_9BACL|nr:EAL domain-containing protein [Planomicrobium soli]PSL40081.1 PAS domain S-box-containing protein/diguanylate cyclase (GGDEF)-like protein [Planomicrobium soli]